MQGSKVAHARGVDVSAKRDQFDGCDRAPRRRRLVQRRAHVDFLNVDWHLHLC